MNLGVVYKLKPSKKINGSLFYCFEYYQFLKKYLDIKFYLVDTNSKDLELIKKILFSKYKLNVDDIITVSTIQLYKLKLDRTLIFDIKTFEDCKEFLTNEIHCFSNESNNLFRYKNDKKVIYYGIYPYQSYDVECMLKLNFEIFPPLENQGYGVFISAASQDYLVSNFVRWKEKFKKPIIIKRNNEGVGNIFELIDSVHYAHTHLDRNNRIIPEAFFYKKDISIEEPFNLKPDSSNFRYSDILENGLKSYTLTEECPIIQAFLK